VGKVENTDAGSLVPGTAPRDLWGLHPNARWVYGALAAVLLTSAILPMHWVTTAPTVCLFHQATGLDCPGCGLTRSFIATADLQFADAFRHHAFGSPLFAVLATMVISWPWSARSRRCLFPEGPMANRGVQAVIALWFIWAIARAAGLLPGP